MKDRKISSFFSPSGSISNETSNRPSVVRDATAGATSSAAPAQPQAADTVHSQVGTGVRTANLQPDSSDTEPELPPTASTSTASVPAATRTEKPRVVLKARLRSFPHAWLTQFKPWLQYDDVGGVMFCK